MKRKDNYTEEQMNWLREYYPILGLTEAHKEFNKKFNQNRSWDAIRTLCIKNKIRCNEKIISNRGRNNAKKYVPIGTVQTGRHGYLYIKIADKKNSRNTNWKLYHRYIYEKEKGPIPKGYYLIFLDGNKTNCNIDNLQAIPASYNALLMKYKLKSETPEITKISIKWCELYETLRKQGYEPKQYMKGAYNE